MDELQMQRRQQQTELFSLPLFSPSLTPCSCCFMLFVAFGFLWAAPGSTLLQFLPWRWSARGGERGSAGGDTFVIVYNLVVGMWLFSGQQHLRSAVTFINCCAHASLENTENVEKTQGKRGKPFGQLLCRACRDTKANPINFLLLIYAAKAHLAMSSNRPGPWS